MLAVWRGQVVPITNNSPQILSQCGGSGRSQERRGCLPCCSTMVFQTGAKAGRQREQLSAAPLKREGAQLQDNNDFPPHLLELLSETHLCPIPKARD